MPAALQSKRVVIAGGSGFLGTSLAYWLSGSGADVTLLSRNNPKVNGPWKSVLWDARTVGDWADTLSGSTAIVNLVGRTVDCIKTPDHRDEIFRSRIESTQALGDAMRSIAQPPPVWVQMSTAHIYGDPPEVVCSEDSALGYGFAPNVGKAWEAQFKNSVLPDQRGVILRTSFVIGRDRGAGGGALGTLRMLTRFGLGGTVGSGKQGFSWIHENDMNQIIQRSILDPSMSDVYIASSPNPISQKEFMRQMRSSMKMPIGLPATELMVRLGAHFFLRTDPDIALYGRYVIPARLLDQGYEFEFPEVGAAFDDLFS